MITVLLEKIIQILEGWIQSFASHAQHVEDKLDSIDSTASDIETNTDPIPDIRDNTAAIITPIQNIKSNTDSIATSSQTSANNTTAILNNISTLSTNTGRAAAFAEDCATNTLDIKDKTVTIASDTTQIRADSGNIRADVSEIKEYLGYYVANTPVTEDSEGDICNFDTDLEDYLQKLKVNIPVDLSGFTGLTLNKCGKNILNYSGTTKTVWAGSDDATLVSFINSLPEGTYNMSFIYNIDIINGTSTVSQYGLYFSNIDSTYNFLIRQNVSTPTIDTPTAINATFTITSSSKGNFNHCYFYCGRNGSPDTVSFTNFMCEISAVNTEYEAYKGITYNVSFGSTITDGAEADLLSGLVKVNTTPASFIQIQPIAIRTYKGINNIYSDIGSTALTYRETLKHYLDKNNQ